MRERTSRALVLALILATVAGSAQAASNLWFHVTVDEDDGAKVTVNLPLALAEKALPMLPMDHVTNWSHHVDHHGTDLEDIRELWAEVKNSPDMTFVTADDGDEQVKVWKEQGFVRVEVRDGDREQVDVQVPLEVVEALFAGEEIDLVAALEALNESGGGELVSVRDHEDNVRVWIDDSPSAR